MGDLANIAAPYMDGYCDGQNDALTWLTVDACDDAPLAPFDGSVQMRAALVCLAHNLTIAGALCEAFSQGYEQHEHEQLYSNHGYRTEQDWRPGHALKETP